MSLVQKTQASLDETLTTCGVSATDAVAVAVSGGADSMALALLAKSIRNVTALTVDHGLRSESATEAKWVNAELAKHSIPAHILNCQWPEVPTSNVQAAAREQRYQLMSRWCDDNQVKFLLTAHHREDQAETFLLRLARGSGVYGLAGMPHFRDLSQNVTLVRPFLEVPKHNLKGCLNEMEQTWIDDPSNQNDAFDRVKIREFIDNPPLDGFSAERLAETAHRLQRTRDALVHYERLWLSQFDWHEATAHAEFNLAVFDAAPEDIVLRGLKTAIQCVGGANYGVRFEKLERLLNAVKTASFKGSTLGGAQFTPLQNGQILIAREHSAVQGNVPLRQGSVWDNRFEVVKSNEPERDDMEIGALGEQGITQLNELDAHIVGDKVSGLPRVILLSAPAIWNGDTLVALPTLGLSLDGSDWSDVLVTKCRLVEN